MNLELEGYRVLEAPTLAAARRLIEEEEVDVILLDVHVGSENGTALLQELDPAGPRVVLFTGTAEIAEEHRRRVAGVVPKPFTLDQLSGAVSGARR